MFAVATATTGLALVTEIDSGYFDKLLVAPIRRTSLILGRLGADLVRGIAASHGRPARGSSPSAPTSSPESSARSSSSCSRRSSASPMPASGSWSRCTTRNVQATNTSFLLFFPLLFLTPNFVPFDRLSPVMETSPGSTRSAT